VSEDLARLAVDAWLYGYPLVTMDVSRRVMTSDPDRAPLNAFDHMRTFPDATFTDVVSPDADTLYSSAWLDLRAEPMVLSLPDTGGRHYMMPMLSGWTDVFAAPGSRTTGNRAGDFAICGPGWRGDLPTGVRRIDAPTTLAWITGRTRTTDTRDYLAVHALQDTYRLTPLSRFEPTAAAPAPVVPWPTGAGSGTPVDQVHAMEGPAFFTRLAGLLTDNPPAEADAPALARFAVLGLVPGRPWDAAGLGPEARDAVAAAPGVGAAALKEAMAAHQSKTVNGWYWPRNLGRYGTDYAERAMVTYFGLGASLDADALCPNAHSDMDGRPLTGEHRYELRFDAATLPPVNGFWSLTLYDDKQAFVDNPLDRYAIGDRDLLATGDDGSLTLYIQHETPGRDLESNWLPAPTGAFNLYFRLYWPQDSVLDGTWQLPPVTRTG
jgi:hypothetical protein